MFISSKCQRKRIELKKSGRHFTESFPNLSKGINLQTQKFEQTPNRINQKMSTLRSIIVKLLKTRQKKEERERERRAVSRPGVCMSEWSRDGRQGRQPVMSRHVNRPVSDCFHLGQSCICHVQGRAFLLCLKPG